MTKADVLDQRSRSIKYNILQREVDTNRTLDHGLLQRYKEIGVAGGVGTNNISIVDRAERPGAPSSPRLTFNLLVSFLAEAILGIASAFGFEYMDDTFKSPEDVESSSAMPVIGIIPRPQQGVTLSDALADARSGVSEAYRSLRTALQFLDCRWRSKDAFDHQLAALGRQDHYVRQPGKDLHANRHEGPGHRCRPSQPVLAQGIPVSQRGRLVQLPRRRETAAGGRPGDCVQGDLTFISSGPLPPNPAELLAGARLMSLLTLASESFDVVLVDGPPIMGSADAPLLASNVSGTLLVVAANETRREAAKVAVKRLHFARAPIVGALLSKFDTKQVGYGYGYAYGGYDYQSRDDKDTPRLAPKVANG